MTDSIIQGKTTDENRPVKRFGYVVSLIFIVLSNVGLVLNWWITGWLYLITMFFLTGSLWVPQMLNPIYKLYLKLTGVKGTEKKETKPEE